MLDVAWTGHLGRHVDHSGGDFLRHERLQSLGIVDAVPQRDQQCIRHEIGPDCHSGTLGVARLDAEEHDIPP
jgi:hypothetical protein